MLWVVRAVVLSGLSDAQALNAAIGSPSPRPKRATRTWLPREHGFWVMLGALLLSAAARDPEWPALLTAAAVAGAAILVGGRLHSQVRRRSWLQLASSFVLAACNVPIQLAGGGRPSEALANALAWSVVFATFTLSVWACTARNSRVRRSRVGPLTLLSLLLPALAALGFSLLHSPARALAALLAVATAAFFALWRPGAKQLKPIGLTLTANAAVAAVILALA